MSSLYVGIYYDILLLIIIIITIIIITIITVIGNDINNNNNNNNNVSPYMLSPNVLGDLHYPQIQNLFIILFLHLGQFDQDSSFLFAAAAA